METKYLAPFTVKISGTIITSMWFSRMCMGRPSVLGLIVRPGLLTVFPWRQPVSGPHICSAAMMSVLVTGQFGIKLLSTRCSSAQE
eukprot:1016971-Ditylum_brightwellii.AAC.1